VTESNVMNLFTCTHFERTQHGHKIPTVNACFIRLELPDDVRLQMQYEYEGWLM